MGSKLMSESDLIDFSKLMPADSEKWSRMELVSLNEALLLSLDVDPEIFQMVWKETLAAHADDGFAPSPSYGAQEVELIRRRDVLQNSIQAASISVVVSPSGVRRVRMADFVCWADDKGFVLPQWMTSKWLPKRAGRKAEPLPETARRNAKLVELASEVLAHTPNITKTDLAKRVERKLAAASEFKQISANAIRNLLFNSEDALISQERLVHLRKQVVQRPRVG